MDNFIIPAISALAGSAIGASASIIAIMIQSNREALRHRYELALKMASDERQYHTVVGKAGQAVPPISVYLAYYLALLSHMAKGPLKASDIVKLDKQNKQLMAALEQAAQRRQP